MVDTIYTTVVKLVVIVNTEELELPIEPLRLPPNIIFPLFRRSKVDYENVMEYITNLRMTVQSL